MVSTLHPVYHPLANEIKHAQIFDILEAVTEVTDEGMVEMFEHTSLPDDVPHALGSHHYQRPSVICESTSYALIERAHGGCSEQIVHTFIFANVLEGKG